MRQLFEYVSIRNIVTVTQKMSFQFERCRILENLESNFDMTRTELEGGRPNAPNIAITTEYCP